MAGTKVLGMVVANGMDGTSVKAECNLSDHRKKHMESNYKLLVIIISINIFNINITNNKAHFYSELLSFQEFSHPFSNPIR